MLKVTRKSEAGGRLINGIFVQNVSAGFLAEVVKYRTDRNPYIMISLNLTVCAAAAKQTEILTRFQSSGKLPPPTRHGGRYHVRWIPNHLIILRRVNHPGTPTGSIKSMEPTPKKRGRPRTLAPKQPKSVAKIEDSARLHIVISQAEKTRLEAMAKAAGLTLGEYLRRVLANHK